jgi:transcriptional regulator with XRE-family HTH domain
MAYVNLSVQFGQRVTELRKAAGISQEAFANKHGFARSYMSKIERGKANVALDAVQRLAEGLGVEPKALFEHPAPSAPVRRKAKPQKNVPFAAD